MDWFAQKINSLIEKVLFILLSAMTTIVFLQILFRYAFNIPLYWSEEAARYIMIWIVFLGASIGIRRGSHLGFTWIVDRTGAKAHRALGLVSNLGLLAFSLNITYFGMIITLQNTKQLSSGLQMPIAFVYACLPIGGTLCIIQLIPILRKLIFPPNTNVSTLKSAGGKV